MPFFRLSELKRHHLNPHLSSGEGPVIEGHYMYFRINIKRAGTGSEMHYHPNELMTFPITGKINCVVGKERQIVPPGTFVHVPPFARHSFKATEDGEVQYLYIKDRTWTLIGAAADESLPDEAPSATQVAKALQEGKWPGKAKDPEKSQAIIEGLGRCFYPMIEFLDAPGSSAHNEQWVEGVNLAFGFLESPSGHESGADVSAREQFLYVIQGVIEAEVDGENKKATAGDVIHVPKGKAYRWRVGDSGPARYAMVRSTPKLEAEIERNGAADNWRG